MRIAFQLSERKLLMWRTIAEVEKFSGDFSHQGNWNTKLGGAGAKIIEISTEGFMICYVLGKRKCT